MDELTDYERLVQVLSQLAVLVRLYYQNLIDQGFSPEQALQLTINYQNSMIGSWKAEK